MNSAYLTGEKGAHLLGAMLLMVGVARLMGKGGFADYGFVIALTALFVPVLDFGLNNRVIKAVASRGDQAKRATADAVGLKLVLAPPALAVMGLVGWAAGKSWEILAAVLLVGGSTVAMSLGDAVSSIFKGLQRPIFSALLVAGLNVLLLGTGVGAMGMGLGLLGIGVSYLVCRSLYFVLAMAVVGWIDPDLRPPLRPGIRRVQFAQGLQHLPAPYYLGNLLHLAYVATYLSVDVSVSAPFFIGYRLAAALFILASAGQEAVLPALTERFGQVSGLGRALLRAFWAQLGITLGAVGIVQVAARPVTVWIFGDDYLPAVAAVRLLAWTAPPLVLSGLAHTALLAMERQRAASLAMLATLAGGTVTAALAVQIGGAQAGGLAPALVGLVSAGVLWTAVWRTARRTPAV
ncbi:MAG: hypothetical protein QGI83_06680 [Candidatus Latescibacteria bacterium]|nr:hypothetical protein [Candidatus Latescibacterota bacterium]